MIILLPKGMCNASRDLVNFGKQMIIFRQLCKLLTQLQWNNNRSLLLCETFLTPITCETQHEFTNIARRAVRLQQQSFLLTFQVRCYGLLAFSLSLGRWSYRNVNVQAQCGRYKKLILFSHNPSIMIMTTDDYTIRYDTIRYGMVD